MTTPITPDPLNENQEPLFDEVVDELGYDPTHPEEPPAGATDGARDEPEPSDP